MLSIDGLQPEKGHEALYVVRELTQKRVWFAEPLLSATADEVRRLIAQARRWSEALGKTVALWLSDRQDAFVTGIAAEFPGVPHRYCQNHFLRDVAKPVLEADSHAKVQMRTKVRGLRTIEQAILKHQRKAKPVAEAPSDEGSSTTPGADPASDVVLEYCAAVRGVLNDDQGGPLHPPGLRMADALDEFRASIQRNLDVKKGGSRKSNSNDLPAVSTGASRGSDPNKKRSAPTSKTSRKSPRPSNRGSSPARTGSSGSRN